MNKATISIYFTIILSLLMTAPLVISVIDKSFDTSIFYHVNEEESSLSNDISQQEILPFFTYHTNSTSFLKLQKIKYIYFYLDDYSVDALETISPPPEYTA